MKIHAIATKAPDPDVIEQLEAMLAGARTGDLTGFIAVASLAGGTARVGAAGMVCRASIIAYAEVIKHRALAEWMAE